MYEKAHKIFITHGGNGFHMGRNLVLEEYRSYNVPKEIEREWAEEEIKKKLIKVCCNLDSSTRIAILSTAINYINDFNLYEFIAPIIKICSKIEPEMNSFRRLCLCELLAEDIPKAFLKKEYIKNYILSICQKVKDNPELPKDFEYSDCFAEVFSPENILKRINTVIESINNQTRQSEQSGDGSLK